MSLVNVPIHSLAAGSQQLLQSSRNSSGLDTGLMSHLKCNLRLKAGARHVLLGRNGCGKTTMLRAIASGKLEGWPQDIRVHLVDQDSSVDLACTPLDVVLAADSKHHELEREMAELDEICALSDDATEIENAGLRLCEIYDIIAESDDGQRQKRACEILSGLGFEPKMLRSCMQELSGGWRMRCMLAAALFMEPELLLLDEPTNHLDLSAINWFQQHLVNEFPGTVLCVSHDRAFVNTIADEILVFTEERTLEYFTGNLDELHRHAEKIARRTDRHDAARQKQMQQIEKKMEKFDHQLQKMGNGLSSNIESKKYGIYQGLAVTNMDKASARAKKEMKKLERLEREADGERSYEVDPVSLQIIETVDDSWAAALAPRFQAEDSALKFAFKEAEPLNLPRDVPMLQLSAASFHYPDSEKDVLTNIDLSIIEGCRIAIVGKNGAGKSTLIKLLSGHFAPTSGEVTRSNNLRIAEFGQHDAEMLQQKHLTPFQYLQECFPKMREHELCEQLNAFGVTPSMMQQPLAELSGGQRMRVAFARMCAEEPHLLILDEPTNHLDVYAIEALCDALKEFQGGVIFASHNRYLVEEVADVAVVVGGGQTRTENASNVDKQRFKLEA